MYYETKPILSKEKYQHKRRQLFRGMKPRYTKDVRLVQWIANKVLRGNL